MDKCIPQSCESDYSRYRQKQSLSGVESEFIEVIILSIKGEDKLVQMLSEAQQELDEASKSNDLWALSEAYDSHWMLKPIFCLNNEWQNSLYQALLIRSEQAENRLNEAAKKVKTIQEALKLAQNHFDKIYDEATKTNQLIDFILQNPNNWVISPKVQSPQKISDILDSLHEELSQKLVTKKEMKEIIKKDF